MTVEIRDAWHSPLIPWLTECVSRHQTLIDHRLSHGDLPRWHAALADLPAIAGHALLDADAVGLATIPDESITQLETALRGLMPWRKGPYRFGSITVETEWRSDRKWDRLSPWLDLTDQRVLDVGSGSGYHLWRMRGAGAREVLGIDPSVLFHCQFAAVKSLLGPHPVASLPVTLDEFQAGSVLFDTVFSMGVLYHRKDPLGHLDQLGALIAPGGTLVLETLIVPGDAETVLVPPGRYARMNNVWFLPSVAQLMRWLDRLGYVEVTHRDTALTTVDEQRQTDWMRFESFEHALDADAPDLTVEGLPRPRRAVISAKRPENRG